MFIKKTIASLAALLTIVAMPCFQAFAAENEETAVTAEAAAAYETVTRDVVYYTNDNIQKIDCRYYQDMPNIAYVSFADFIKIWGSEEITVKNNGNGIYELTNPLGSKALCDTVNETISSDNGAFGVPTYLLGGDSPLANLFARSTDENEEMDLPPIAFDFSKYEIDLRGDENAVWFPISTLCDLYSIDSMSVFYLADTLFIRSSSMSSDSFQSAFSKEIGDHYAEKYKNGRPEDLIKYNYNELCFIVDTQYGYPGRPYFTDLLREKGMDGFLREGSDTTRQIREWLLSSDPAEYAAGYYALNKFLSDGGHTVFGPSLILNDEIKPKALALLSAPSPDTTGMTDSTAESLSKEASQAAVVAARTACLEDGAENVETKDFAVYFEKGDTAFFVFDSFNMDMMGWIAYYTQNGTLPDDVVSFFEKCVVKADQNEKIKNFVIDIATNGGGYVLIAQYMAGIVGNMTESYVCDNRTGKITTSHYIYDKNLDGEINEADDAFNTALRFAVLTSNNSYSSGTLFPSLCHDSGVMIIGEQSGGGSCNEMLRLTPDGMFYGMSYGNCTIDKNHVSVDNGIPVDYVLFTESEDGTKDFSAAYDIATLDACFDRFYGAAEESVTATTSEAVTTTTTTAAETTTSPATVSETAPVTSASASETATPAETTAAQQTAETTASTTEEKIYSQSKIADMAKKDYESKHGTAPANVSVRDNADGTYSVTLSDASGKVLDTYTVDAKTAKGTDSNGSSVDLPQTGNNALGTAAAAAAAAVLLLTGTALTAVTFRKKEENA